MRHLRNVPVTCDVASITIRRVLSNLINLSATQWLQCNSVAFVDFIEYHQLCATSVCNAEGGGCDWHICRQNKKSSSTKPITHAHKYTKEAHKTRAHTHTNRHTLYIPQTFLRACGLYKREEKNNIEPTSCTVHKTVVVWSRGQSLVSCRDKCQCIMCVCTCVCVVLRVRSRSHIADRANPFSIDLVRPRTQSIHSLCQRTTFTATTAANHPQIAHCCRHHAISYIIIKRVRIRGSTKCGGGGHAVVHAAAATAAQLLNSSELCALKMPCKCALPLLHSL